MDFASPGHGPTVSKIINGTTLVDLRRTLVAASADLMPNSNATADQRTEANATTGWTGEDAAVSSVLLTTLGNGAGTYALKILGNAGDGTSIGEARSSISTTSGVKYRFRGYIWTPSDNTITVNPVVKIGTAAGGSQIKSVSIAQNASWMEVEFNFVAEGSTTYVTIYGALDTEAIYADNVSVFATIGLSPKYQYPRGFTVVTEWQSADLLKVTNIAGVETTLTNLGSKAYQADRFYPIPGWAFMRSSGTNEDGSGDFEILVHY